MANPTAGDKCAHATAAMRDGDPLHVLPPALRKPGQGAAQFALAAAAFLHSERNFLRSSPCNPLASACLEHSSETAVRGFAAFFSAAAGGAVVFAAGAGVAGV